MSGGRTRRRRAPRTDDRRDAAGIDLLLGGDAVRGIGLVLVFATHVFLLADPVPFNNMRSYGWASSLLGHIDLALGAFFVLSGYLIARPYARAYVAGTRKPRLRSYVRNRVLRIVPAFYLFTIVVLLRFGLDGSLETGAAAPGESSTWWQVLGQFAFVQAQTQGPASIPIGPAWSICAEVGFYVLIPLAAALAYRVSARVTVPLRRALIALVAITLVMLVSIRLRAVDQYLFAWLTSPPAIMFGFMPGVAIAIVEPLIAARLRADARLAKLLGWSAFAFAAVTALLYAGSDYDVRQTPIHHALGVRALLAALCTGALIFGLVALQLGTGGTPRLFRSRVLLWMGARSYSFYLAHIWVLLEIDHVIGRSDPIATRVIVMTAVGFPITMAIAALAYRYVELPFLARKRKAVPPAGDRERAGAPALAACAPVPAGAEPAPADERSA